MSTTTDSPLSPSEPAADPPLALPADGPGKVIVGLGNPGEKYSETRHNYGFWVVEELARRWRVELEGDSCRCLLASDAGNLLAQPQTFMNRSGLAVRCLAEKWGFRPRDFLMVFDDIDLPLGTLRMRKSGGPGGHRGLESVIENLRTTDVPRLRIGIRPATSEESASQGSAALPTSTQTQGQLSDFVLAPFSAAERSTVEAEIQRAADACQCWLEQGADRAMANFNGTNPES